MIYRKTISIMLVLLLALSSITMVYGDEDQSGGDTTAATGEAIGNGDGEDSEDEPSESDLEEVTTDHAVEIQNPTTEAVVPDDVPKKSVAPMAVTENYFVQTMSNEGVLKKVGTGYDTIAKANTAMKSSYASSGNKGLVVTDKKNKVLNMISGIAVYKSSKSTFSLGNTYVTPKDALHFSGVSGTNCANSKVRISGVETEIATSCLNLIPETLIYPNAAKPYYRDYYMKNSSGDLVHYTYKVVSPTTSTPYKKGTEKSKSSGGFVVDKAPSWMSKNKMYYSTDGIKFYSDPSMTSRVGSDYYAYYKYLPYRSMSIYTSTELNKWINNKTPGVKPTSKTSKLKNQGRNLVNAQNRYGINGVTELAFACLESAHGKSSYALNRNNLFGINAVDSNPDKAYTFSSVRVCINQHTEKHLSRGYGDAKTDGRYFGLTPGSKAVGVNLKYASDPWHGEKISGIAYSIDKYLGGKDYRKFTVGVTNKKSVSVYKNAGSTVLYNLSTKSAGKGPLGIPVVILGSSGNYYQIQSDLPISGSTAKYSYTYYYNKSVAYVKKSDINIINTGSRTYSTQISKNKDLRNITVKVGSTNYFKGFNPGKTNYTVTVPKKTKSVVIKGSLLMTTGTVTGNGKKSIGKKSKSFYIKVKSKSGAEKKYKVTVVPKGASTSSKSSFKFGVYNSKTKLSQKSKKGKKTTVKRPMKIQSKVKTNSKRTTVKMVIYNKNKKVVAQKVQYIYKTKTVKFSWNGKYTKHNKLKKKTGKYAPRSKGGTKYYVRFIASRSGTKTHKGKYHAFYLYK